MIFAVIGTHIVLFSGVDALAQTLMKGVVKCEMQCDMQNPVNQLVVECCLCFQVLPGSMSSSLMLPYMQTVFALQMQHAEQESCFMCQCTKTGVYA